MVNIGIEAIGVISTIFYATRWYFQIKATKKAGRSVTPINYWLLTLAAQITMVIYTYLLGSLVFPAFLLVSIALQLYNINVERNRNKATDGEYYDVEKGEWVSE